MFQHFPHIEGFHNVVKSVAKFPELLPKNIDDLTYCAKVKLHGTNAAIQIRPAGPITTKQKNDSQILIQSRSRIISSGDDNMGFAKWVEESKESWDWPGLELIYSLSHTEQELNPENGLPPITIFGEWCGQGIMKGVAISEIGTKVFCVFAIQVGTSKNEDDTSWVIIDPEQIKSLVPNHPQIKVIPYLGWTLFIDFTCPESMVDIVNFMNNEVDKIEMRDPFVKEEFDVEGTGEGLVFFPIVDEMPFIKRSYFSNLAFKAKGEKHKVTKQRNAVQIDPEVMATISEFVQKTVTEARLEQGAREIARGELEFDMKKIGPFLGWIGKDVKKETIAELEASELNWKMVQKEVTTQARDWYIAKCKEL